MPPREICPFPHPKPTSTSTQDATKSIDQISCNSVLGGLALERIVHHHPHQGRSAYRRLENVFHLVPLISANLSTLIESTNLIPETEELLRARSIARFSLKIDQIKIIHGTVLRPRHSNASGAEYGSGKTKLCSLRQRSRRFCSLRTYGWTKCSIQHTARSDIIKVLKRAVGKRPTRSAERLVLSLDRRVCA